MGEIERLPAVSDVHPRAFCASGCAAGLLSFVVRTEKALSSLTLLIPYQTGLAPADDGDQEYRSNAPALDSFEAAQREAARREAEQAELDANAGRRIKQHDSPMSAGQEASAPRLLQQLTAEKEARDAAAREARDAVLAQRSKRDALAKEIALAFEEPRARDKLSRLLATCEVELRRRERVAEAAAEAAAAALTAEVRHRDATVGYSEAEARRRAAKDAADSAALRAAAEAKAAAEAEAERRARSAYNASLPEASGEAAAESPTTRRVGRTRMADVVRLRWHSHEARYAAFSGGDVQSVSLGEIPFLDLGLVEMVSKHCPEELDYRALQARWHPDKFQQKFGAALDAGERAEVMARVHDISVAINLRKAEVAGTAPGQAGAE